MLNRIEPTSPLSFAIIPHSSPFTSIKVLRALLRSSTLILSLALIGFLQSASAQGVGASGDVRGTITDPTGAVVPNVKITVADKQIGLQRVVSTDPSGQFHVTALPPSTYEVSAQMSGFATSTTTGVIVPIGQTVVTDFQLKVSSVAMDVVVTGTPPVIET